MRALLRSDFAGAVGGHHGLDLEDTLELLLEQVAYQIALVFRDSHEPARFEDGIQNVLDRSRRI